MRKCFIITLLGISLYASGQTQEGNIMVGSSLLTSTLSFESHNTSFDFTIQPKIGYFIVDNLAIGASLELGIATQKGNTTVNYGITPFARVFAGKDKANEIPRHLKLFFEGGIGFAGLNTVYKDTYGNSVNVTSNGVNIYFGPGADFFLSNTVAFETGVTYRFIGGSPVVNQFALNVGFQVFLSHKQIHKIKTDTEVDIKKDQREMHSKKRRS